MDRKLFKKLLSQVAKIESRADGGDRRSKVSETNTTYPVVIVKLIDKPGVCADCGRVCDHAPGRDFAWRQRRWHERCRVCKFARDPGTGQFAPAGSQAVILREPEPSPPPQPEPQLDTIETLPSEPDLVEYVEQVVVRDYHEFVIKEYSRCPVEPQPDQGDAPDFDNGSHKC